MLFVGYLVDEGKQSSTVHSYVSAIKNVLKDDGHKIQEDQFLIASLTRACKLKNDSFRTRLPIQQSMLAMILKKVDKLFPGQPYLKILYQALFSTAYFGLFRVGELTKGDHPVLACDIHIGFNKRKLLFILRTSKTHGKGSKPQLVKILSIQTKKHSENAVDGKVKQYK